MESQAGPRRGNQHACGEAAIRTIWGAILARVTIAGTSGAWRDLPSRSLNGSWYRECGHSRVAISDRASLFEPWQISRGRQNEHHRPRRDSVEADIIPG